MPDDVDIAAELEELFLGDAIRRARSQPPLMVEAYEGECLLCGDELDEPKQRWCSPDCTREWERRQEVKRKQGR